MRNLHPYAGAPPRLPSSTILSYVDERGEPKTARAARLAWEDACAQAGYIKPGETITPVYTIKDIRAKSLSDAEDMGYSRDQIKVGAVHESTSTTAGYLRKKKIPLSSVVIAMPALVKAGAKTPKS